MEQISSTHVPKEVSDCQIKSNFIHAASLLHNCAAGLDRKMK